MRPGPLLWMHSFFGIENFNGHITSIIHSKRKLAEQLLFSIDVCQTIGNIADILVEKDEATLSFFAIPSFFAPLSTSFSQCRKNMTLISLGIYSIGKLKSCSLLNNEISTLQKLSLTTNKPVCFDKLYLKETILICDSHNGKRDSSICSYIENGEKRYGIVQKNLHLFLLQHF